MRQAYNDKSIIRDKSNNIIGISLGYDFASEHERGIEGLSKILNIGNSIKKENQDLSSYKNVLHEFITPDLIRFYKKHNMGPIVDLLSFKDKSINPLSILNNKNKYSNLLKLAEKTFPHYKNMSKLTLEDYKIKENSENHHIKFLSFKDKRVPMSLFFADASYFNLFEYEAEAFSYLKSLEDVEKIEDLNAVKSNIVKILKKVSPLTKVNIKSDKIIFNKGNKYQRDEDDNNIYSAWSDKDFLVIGFNEESEGVTDFIEQYKNGNLVHGIKEMRSKLDLDNKNIGGLTFYRYDKVNIPAIRDNILRKNINEIIGYYALHRSGIYEALKKADKKFIALSPNFSMENGKPKLDVWLNPYDQENNEYGWYSLDELFDWSENKGPVIGNSRNYKNHNNTISI